MKRAASATNKKGRKPKQPKRDPLCKGCINYLPMACFSKREQAKHAKGERARCKVCFLSPEARRKKLAAPRKCSDCGKKKGQQGFSEYQWHPYCHDLEQICLDCYPVEREKEDRYMEHWEDHKEKILQDAKQGAVYYDFKYDDLTRTAPNLSDLEGCSYSILFHSGQAGHEAYTRRTTKGTLTFFKVPETQELVGDIEFDQSVPACGPPGFNATYSIVEADYEELWLMRDTNETAFTVEDLEDPDEIINPGNDQVLAYLSVVQERFGWAWIPSEDMANARMEEHFGKDALVKFDSLEEADAIVQKQKDMRSTKSWIHKHLFPSVRHQLLPVSFMITLLGGLPLFSLWNLVTFASALCGTQTIECHTHPLLLPGK